MKRTISFLETVGVLALAGCATCPPPKVETREVLTPVASRCIDPAAVPAEPAKVQLPLDARQAADLAASQALTLRKWGRDLVALITPCTVGDK